MSFKEKLSEAAEAVEGKIEEILSARFECETLDRSVAYSLQNGGKRLRAFLVTAFCELVGGKPEDCLDLAAAIEMIQAFSLIHDDLPAMDDDDMRRGKPSNHKVFGEATAILAGDALALDAFGVIAEANIPAGVIVDAIAVLSSKSGVMGMCAGQQYDLDGEGVKNDIDGLMRIIDHKTGALFSAACMMGVIAVFGDSRRKTAAERFGLLTGRAFQITDDILDVTSTSEVLGKTVGKDIAQEKSTFTSLLGVERSRKTAEDCINAAKKALDEFDDGEAKQTLFEFCDFILTRTK